MTRSGLPALLLLVCLLAGCGLTGSAKGVSPPKPLSKGRFVYLMRRATNRLACAVPHGKPTSPAQARASIVKLERGFDRWLFALRGLRPPTAEAPLVHRLLGALDKLDVLLHRLGDAVDAGDLPRIKALQKQFHHLKAHFDAVFPGHHRNHFVCTKK